MIYGLSEQQFEEVISVLKEYSEIETAVLFGSRAIGTYKNSSDIDIAIKGEKAGVMLAAEIKDRLENDTYLPFFFDIIAYNSIDNDNLKKHIKEHGKTIYKI